MSRLPSSAAIYARISLDRDNEKLGVQRQESDCRALAERLGWSVEQVYIDNSLSASKDVVRPEYGRLLDDLTSGARDGLIVYDLDRLTRKPAELEDFISLSESKGFALANVAGDVDLTTANGKMLARFKGAIARQEAERIGERVSRAAQQRAEQGIPQKAKLRPFGYTADYRIVPDEAEMIRDAYKRAIAGEGLTSITRDFAARFDTVAGGRWSRGTVKKILERPANAGIRTYRGKEVGEGNWVPIVDRATYEACMSVLESRRTAQPDYSNVYLLSTIARCGLCGSAMYGRKRGGRTTHTYTCMPTHGGCGKIVRSREQLDDYILALVQQHINTVEPSTPEIVDYGAAEIERIERKLDQLQQLYADDVLSPADFSYATKIERDKIKQLRQRESKASASVIVSSFAEKFADGNLSQQRTIIKSLISAVLIHPTKKGQRKLDYDQITVVWR
ncbi:recombinase family protein [Rhodococcus fascians]|nr:recombinase family protein [Rhodococcus fascians]MBY4416260.1 recombinase family protein [Rhodococcus fascians]